MSKQNQKWSFDVVKAQVEELQNEFNSKLVSVLNNCKEPIIIGVVPPYVGSRDREDAINYPVLINVLQEKNIGQHAAHIYSSST
jgi:hypothetical protein